MIIYFQWLINCYLYPSVVHYILDKDFELNANVGHVYTWMLRFSLDP